MSYYTQLLQCKLVIALAIAYHCMCYIHVLEKQIDLVNANFKKMKVKELKKILAIWSEDCKACSEKSDFISKIESLLPKYAPEAHAARQAKTEL